MTTSPPHVNVFGTRRFLSVFVFVVSLVYAKLVVEAKFRLLVENTEGVATQWHLWFYNYILVIYVKLNIAKSA